MKNIILASTSPRRKELLEKFGLPFKVVGSNYEEDMEAQMEPMELAKRLSQGKAKAVTPDHKDSLIIAADTFVVLGKELLGKPHTPQKAIEALKKIHGKCVSVITGITVIDTTDNKMISQSMETKIFIKKLSDREIQSYVDSGEPLDKAGAFAIQDLGAAIVEKIEGDYHNTVWLPLYALSEMLKEFGINVL